MSSKAQDANQRSGSSETQGVLSNFHPSEMTYIASDSSQNVIAGTSVTELFKQSAAPESGESEHPVDCRHSSRRNDASVNISSKYSVENCFLPCDNIVCSSDRPLINTTRNEHVVKSTYNDSDANTQYSSSKLGQSRLCDSQSKAKNTHADIEFNGDLHSNYNSRYSSYASAGENNGIQYDDTASDANGESLRILPLVLDSINRSELDVPDIPLHPGSHHSAMTVKSFIWPDPTNKQEDIASSSRGRVQTDPNKGTPDHSSRTQKYVAFNNKNLPVSDLVEDSTVSKKANKTYHNMLQQRGHITTDTKHAQNTCMTRGCSDVNKKCNRMVSNTSNSEKLHVTKNCRTQKLDSLSADRINLERKRPTLKQKDSKGNTGNVFGRKQSNNNKDAKIDRPAPESLRDALISAPNKNNEDGDAVDREALNTSSEYSRLSSSSQSSSSQCVTVIANSTSSDNTNNNKYNNSVCNRPNSSIGPPKHRRISQTKQRSRRRRKTSANAS